MAKGEKKIFHTRAEANAAGYDIVLNEPVEIENFSDFKDKAKRLRVYDAYLVIPSDRKDGTLEVYPLLRWGKDIKSIGVNPSNDMTTGEY